MQWFWTWGGECFGYRRDDKLFTHNGVQAGRFYEDEVYGADGRYLGEIRNSNRLITNSSKRHKTKSAFSPSMSGSYVPYVGYVGYVMYVGYEDFPSPDQFR